MAGVRFITRGSTGCWGSGVTQCLRGRSATRDTGGHPRPSNWAVCSICQREAWNGGCRSGHLAIDESRRGSRAALFVPEGTGMALDKAFPGIWGMQLKASKSAWPVPFFRGEAPPCHVRRRVAHPERVLGYQARLLAGRSRCALQAEGRQGQAGPTALAIPTVYAQSDCSIIRQNSFWRTATAQDVFQCLKGRRVKGGWFLSNGGQA